MKYRDIIGIEAKTLIGASPILYHRCIAWTAGHETAIFDVDAEIHPAAVAVWLFPCYYNQMRGEYERYMAKFTLKSGEWQFAEMLDKEMSKLEVMNFNPFCPFDKKYTGGHFACCQFPQNYKKHPDGYCANTVMVEGRRLKMNE